MQVKHPWDGLGWRGEKVDGEGRRGKKVKEGAEGGRGGTGRNHA